MLLGQKFWALRVFGPWIFSIVVTEMTISGLQMLAAQMWNIIKGRNKILGQYFQLGKHSSMIHMQLREAVIYDLAEFVR